MSFWTRSRPESRSLRGPCRSASTGQGWEAVHRPPLPARTRQFRARDGHLCRRIRHHRRLPSRGRTAGNRGAPAACENAEVGFWDVDHIHDVLIWPARTKAMFGIPGRARFDARLRQWPSPRRPRRDQPGLRGPRPGVREAPARSTRENIGKEDEKSAGWRRRGAALRRGRPLHPRGGDGRRHHRPQARAEGRQLRELGG